MATQGGPAQSVSVQTNGQRQGGPAQPVAVVSDGRAQVAGPAQPVYVVTSGPVLGGPALPIVAAAAGSKVAAGTAIPVYVVSGSLGGTLFDPTQITSLKAWWKASSIAQGDNTAVASWTDVIGGIAAVQATGSLQPTYRTSLGPNSTPCVSFDGGDRLVSANVLGSLLFATNQCDIVIVQKQTGTDDQNTTFNWTSNSTTNTVNTHLTYIDALYWDYGDKNVVAGGGRVTVAQPIGWDNTWRIIELFRDSGNNQTIRDQGAQLVTASRSKTVDVTASAPVRIGCDDSGAIFLTGFVTDIFVCNATLSASDRSKLETWLNGLYTIF